MRVLGRVVADAFALVLIAIAVVMLSGRVSVQPVLSGSMTGFASRGDLVVGVATDATSLHVGDVILFAPPAPYNTPGDHAVAHRIFDIRVVDGTPVATTKGDANPSPDPWNLDLSRTRTAEVRLVLPDAGWPFLRLRLLTTPAGRMSAGIGLMAAGAVILAIGRKRSRRSDEPWPPPFEGAALERRLGLLQHRHPDGDVPDPAPASRYGTVEAPTGTLSLIPRQRSRAWSPEPWSREETLAHSPID
jgi:signal peptidase I